MPPVVVGSVDLNTIEKVVIDGKEMIVKNFALIETVEKGPHTVVVLYDDPDSPHGLGFKPFTNTMVPTLPAGKNTKIN